MLFYEVPYIDDENAKSDSTVFHCFTGCPSWTWLVIAKERAMDLVGPLKMSNITGAEHTDTLNDSIRL